MIEWASGQVHPEKSQAKLLRQRQASKEANEDEAGRQLQQVSWLLRCSGGTMGAKFHGRQCWLGHGWNAWGGSSKVPSIETQLWTEAFLIGGSMNVQVVDYMITTQ